MVGVSRVGGDRGNMNDSEYECSVCNIFWARGIEMHPYQVLVPITFQRVKPILSSVPLQKNGDSWGHLSLLDSIFS